MRQCESLRLVLRQGWRCQHTQLRWPQRWRRWRSRRSAPAACALAGWHLQQGPSWQPRGAPLGTSQAAVGGRGLVPAAAFAAAGVVFWTLTAPQQLDATILKQLLAACSRLAACAPLRLPPESWRRRCAAARPARQHLPGRARHSELQLLRGRSDSALRLWAGRDCPAAVWSERAAQRLCARAARLHTSPTPSRPQISDSALLRGRRSLTACSPRPCRARGRLPPSRGSSSAAPPSAGWWAGAMRPPSARLRSPRRLVLLPAPSLAAGAPGSSWRPQQQLRRVSTARGHCMHAQAAARPASAHLHTGCCLLSAGGGGIGPADSQRITCPPYSQHHHAPCSTH